MLTRSYNLTRDSQHGGIGFYILLAQSTRFALLDSTIDGLRLNNQYKPSDNSQWCVSEVPCPDFITTRRPQKSALCQQLQSDLPNNPMYSSILPFATVDQMTEVQFRTEGLELVQLSSLNERNVSETFQQMD